MHLHPQKCVFRESESGKEFQSETALARILARDRHAMVPSENDFRQTSKPEGLLLVSERAVLFHSQPCISI